MQDITFCVSSNLSKTKCYYYIATVERMSGSCFDLLLQTRSARHQLVTHN